MLRVTLLSSDFCDYDWDETALAELEGYVNGLQPFEPTKPDFNNVVTENLRGLYLSQRDAQSLFRFGSGENVRAGGLWV